MYKHPAARAHNENVLGTDVPIKLHTAIREIHSRVRALRLCLCCLVTLFLCVLFAGIALVAVNREQNYTFAEGIYPEPGCSRADQRKSKS